jgi:N-methylhydantoinase B
MTVAGSDIRFRPVAPSPPCKGPLNGVWASTQSAVYVAMKHIFPDVPINSGCFAPLHVARPQGTFLVAEYPRPVAGCASEVAQRVMEAVFGAMGEAIPERMFASPAGTSGNFSLGGWDPGEKRSYIMYFFSGGGYWYWLETDVMTKG